MNYLPNMSLMTVFLTFLAFLLLRDERISSVDAFSFHRKLSRNSPLFSKFNGNNQQRIDKRVHNLSLLRFGGKLFRTEQPQVKRLMPLDSNEGTEYTQEQDAERQRVVQYVEQPEQNSIFEMLLRDRFAGAEEY